VKHPSLLATWLIILVLVGLNSAGDMSTAKAMRRVGDFGEIRRRAGLWGIIQGVLTEPWFFIGLSAMTISFFAMLAALSVIDLSIVIPASASMSFLLNLIGAKFILKENVTKRRWISGMLVLGGIVLLRT
jgi:drug/metabolite transporter (DMT)-like permease